MSVFSPCRASNGVGMRIRVDLAEIEMTPLGTGLHWSRFDADVLVGGLIHGVYDTKRWMAAQVGRVGESLSS
ncbi:DUF2442 domain-containing protein [Gluconobacter wancherniae]|uniref:hypothetical protein n=1 Tax=Gluconobacter wancherniae TaxID=1307955 RepID=UPI001B8C566E|nr:hypothetical protein [Gluconobacter wancherniae]MBS1095868.1 hypothetical protein [Gluconobacter wancherniae]